MKDQAVDPTIEKIRFFFPEYTPPDKDREEFSKGPEYLSNHDDILPYLQTLFFEERVISVQVDDITRTHSTMLWDQLPELVEEEIDGEMVLTVPEYEPGSYLKEFSHINILPLEPVSGNMLVRSSSRIILFFYAGTTSVEIGVTFIQVTTVRDQQVIQCSFPEACRVIRNNRAFRAKTLKDEEMFVRVRIQDHDDAGAEYLMFDLSTHGVAFGGPGALDQFEVDMPIDLVIDSRGPAPIGVSGSIRNFSRVRTKKGTMHVCGVLFDLENRLLASKIEKQYAAMQRAYIRSLKEETEGLDVDLQVH